MTGTDTGTGTKRVPLRFGTATITEKLVFIFSGFVIGGVVIVLAIQMSLQSLSGYLDATAANTEGAQRAADTRALLFQNEAALRQAIAQMPLGATADQVRQVQADSLTRRQSVDANVSDLGVDAASKDAKDKLLLAQGAVNRLDAAYAGTMSTLDPATAPVALQKLLDSTASVQAQATTALGDLSDNLVEQQKSGVGTGREKYDSTLLLLRLGAVAVLCGALGMAFWLGKVISRAVSRNNRNLDVAATDLAEVSASMAGTAEETSAQANVVAASAEEVSANVATVAAAVEQMGSSVRQIAEQAEEANRVAAEAVDAAESTNVTVAKLGESSTEIGQVIGVITAIAAQTNLLALNATIEAARAGEAGKGFAVVANEVKELAKQTAVATEKISGQISAIQADTGGAVEAIGHISTVIGRIADIQTTIAAAVEEQTATTSEIARSVAEAARGSADIAENILGVASAARQTTEAATATQTTAGQVQEVALDLQRLVSRKQINRQPEPASADETSEEAVRADTGLPGIAEAPADAAAPEWAVFTPPDASPFDDDYPLATTGPGFGRGSY